MFELRVRTSPAWTDTVLRDLDAFLVDHAACERKASATALSFVVRYPDRTELLGPLIALAREELEHFEQVAALIVARGGRLGPDEKDPYVGRMLECVRTGRDERFLDRLVVSAVVEARGCERFGMLAVALSGSPLGAFYAEITRSEARHRGLFLRLARAYFPESLVDQRLSDIVDFEGRVVEALALRPALH